MHFAGNVHQLKFNDVKAMAIPKLYRTISKRSSFMARGLTPAGEAVHFDTVYVCHK